MGGGMAIALRIPRRHGASVPRCHVVAWLCHRRERSPPAAAGYMGDGGACHLRRITATASASAATATDKAVAASSQVISVLQSMIQPRSIPAPIDPSIGLPLLQ